ncbi:hypothetical protein B7760_03438 [Burkholderia glumae]|nr:hypothetical protein B7760_03438 [Burkholderia glumae]RQZ72131.1 hypothetical protein DF052_17590 [Burkholderia glumae]
MSMFRSLSDAAAPVRPPAAQIPLLQGLGKRLPGLATLDGMPFTRAFARRSRRPALQSTTRNSTSCCIGAGRKTAICVARPSAVAASTCTGPRFARTGLTGAPSVQGGALPIAPRQRVRLASA